MSDGGHILLMELPIPWLSLRGHPTGLALAPPTLASLLAREGWRVRLAEEEAETHGDRALLDFVLADDPAALALTCTVWNVERSLHLCRALRRRRPEMRLWLGGPELADDSPWLDEARSLVDACIVGAGEEAILGLASSLSPTSPRRGAMTPPRPHRDGWIAPSRDGSLASEWRRGCDRGCSFCRYGANRPGAWRERSHEDIADFLAWARGAKARRLYVLDPSFGSRPDLPDFLPFLAEANRDPQLPLYVELRAEDVDGVRAAALRRAGVHHVELGLQTLGEDARRRVGRPLDLPALLRGLEALKGEGFELSTDLMVGLPGDGPADFDGNLDFVEAQGLVDGLQVFRTQVLPGTRLRREAGALSLRFDSRPPYHVRSTPTWGEEEMEGALARAEARLGLSFEVDAAPSLPTPMPTKAWRREHEAGCSVWFRATFDLKSPEGRAALEREDFAQMANTAMLFFRCASPHGLGELMSRSLLRARETNPFAMLTVVVELDPCAPLGPLGRLRDLRGNGGAASGSYADRFWAPFSTALTPSFRLFLALVGPEDLVPRAWLQAAAEDFELIWLPPAV